MTHAVDHVLATIARGRIVAIIRLDDLSAAVELTRALLRGGITALEFTLTNPAAVTAVAQVREQIAEFERGSAAVGVGTVLSPEAALASVEAGAQFVVSPSTDLRTISACRERGVACMPGALTPTEILTAWQAGASVVKVFPARSLGPAYIKDLREPLPQLRLMPTGGVGAENIGAYLKAGAFAVGMGGRLLDRTLIAAGNWQAISDQAAALVAAVHAARDER